MEQGLQVQINKITFNKGKIEYVLHTVHIDTRLQKH